jgi:hypothetical protein
MEKKRESVGQFLARQEGIKDPLEKEGGSEAFIKAERQSLTDLGFRVVALRRGIQLANEKTDITICGVTRTIADWLIWKRDVAAGEGQFLSRLRQSLNQVREQARKNGASMLAPGAIAEKPTDFVVNINEQELAKEIEQHEEILGALYGQHSLKNATTKIVE